MDIAIHTVIEIVVLMYPFGLVCVICIWNLKTSVKLIWPNRDISVENVCFLCCSFYILYIGIQYIYILILCHVVCTMKL